MREGDDEGKSRVLLADSLKEQGTQNPLRCPAQAFSCLLRASGSNGSHDTDLLLHVRAAGTSGRAARQIVRRHVGTDAKRLTPSLK